MKWVFLIGVPSCLVALIAIGTVIGFEKPWPDKDALDSVEAVVTENRTLIASNADRLALITYDRLLRKMRSQGRLSPRDLRAFCISASRLKIRHPACR